MEQLTMLLDEMDAMTQADRRAAAEIRQRQSWLTCWGWTGPEAGKPCTIDTCVVQTADGGTVYAYTERCMLIEERPDGSWLAEIAMGVSNWWDGPAIKWPKDGTRVILQIAEIWPPVGDIRAARSLEPVKEFTP